AHGFDASAVRSSGEFRGLAMAMAMAMATVVVLVSGSRRTGYRRHTASPRFSPLHSFACPAFPKSVAWVTIPGSMRRQ
ncbi:hypothetical protein G418_22164, partial [Rhodococcus qingshengii BKS 20-40]